MEQLESEKSALEAVVQGYEERDRRAARRRNWVIRFTSRIGLSVFVGNRLKAAVKDVVEAVANRRVPSTEETSALIAATVGRLFRVGLIALLIAAVPMALQVWQTIEMREQTAEVRAQTKELVDATSFAMFEKRRGVLEAAIKDIRAPLEQTDPHLTGHSPELIQNTCINVKKRLAETASDDGWIDFGRGAWVISLPNNTTRLMVCYLVDWIRSRRDMVGLAPMEGWEAVGDLFLHPNKSHQAGRVIRSRNMYDDLLRCPLRPSFHDQLRDLREAISKHSEVLGSIDEELRGRPFAFGLLKYEQSSEEIEQVDIDAVEAVVEADLKRWREIFPEIVASIEEMTRAMMLLRDALDDELQWWLEKYDRRD